MKRILLTLFVTLSSFSLWAKVEPGVRLQLASGKQITILLEDEPKLTFENDDIVITTRRRTIRCESNDLLKFTYINIDKLSLDEAQVDEVRVYFTDEGISASNLKPYSELVIYSQEGKLIYTSRADEYGYYNANFKAQKGLVYIIKTTERTFKMTKQ